MIDTQASGHLIAVEAVFIEKVGFGELVVECKAMQRDGSSNEANMNKKILGCVLYALGIIAFIVVAGISWYKYTNTTLTIAIPSRKMPKPNAFNVYVTVGKTMKHEDKLVNVVQLDKLSLNEKKIIINDNTGVLSKVRSGFGYEYASPPVRSTETRVYWCPLFQSLGLLLVMEGEAKEARGDTDGALQSYLDAIYFGSHIIEGKYTIEVMIGMVAENEGRKRIWNLLNRMNPQQAKAAAQKLEDINAHEVPLSAIFEEEKWTNLSSLVEIYNQHDWRQQLSTVYNEDSKIISLIHTLTYNKHKAICNLTLYCDECIVRSKMAYGSKGSEAPPPINDQLSRIFAPYYDFERTRYLNRAVAQNHLLTVALALQAYEAEHGNYPAKLTALVPNYLKKLPADPFAINSPLSYRSNGKRYVLYSLGPDAKDDGGIAIFDPSQKEIQYHVRAESKGDIVAGVNTETKR